MSYKHFTEADVTLSSVTNEALETIVANSPTLKGIVNYFLDNKETVFPLEPGSWHEFEINNTKVPNSFFSKTYTINYFRRMDIVLDAIAKENRYVYVTSFPADKSSVPAIPAELK